MKVFICKDHDGHWPVGVASVVVAKSKKSAKKLLDAALLSEGLKKCELSPYTLEEVSLEEPRAYVISSGDY